MYLGNLIYKTMGFGGSAQHMITSLKNNFRPRKSAYDKIKNTSFGDEAFVDHKKASPQQLKAIRDRLQKERKEQTKKRIIVSVITVPLAILILMAFYKWVVGPFLDIYEEPPQHSIETVQYD